MSSAPALSIDLVTPMVRTGERIHGTLSVVSPDGQPMPPLLITLTLAGSADTRLEKSELVNLRDSTSRHFRTHTGEAALIHLTSQLVDGDLDGSSASLPFNLPFPQQPHITAEEAGVLWEQSSARDPFQASISHLLPPSMSEHSVRHVDKTLAVDLGPGQSFADSYRCAVEYKLIAKVAPSPSHSLTAATEWASRPFVPSEVQVPITHIRRLHAAPIELQTSMPIESQKSLLISTPDLLSADQKPHSVKQWFKSVAAKDPSFAFTACVSSPSALTTGQRLGIDLAIFHGGKTSNSSSADTDKDLDKSKSKSKSNMSENAKNSNSNNDKDTKATNDDDCTANRIFPQPIHLRNLSVDIRAHTAVRAQARDLRTGRSLGPRCNSISHVLEYHVQASAQGPFTDSGSTKTYLLEGIPEDIPPAFSTWNIARWYTLRLNLVFECAGKTVPMKTEHSLYLLPAVVLPDVPPTYEQLEKDGEIDGELVHSRFTRV